MPVRPSLALLVVALGPCACSRPTDPSPAPTSSEHASAAGAKPVETQAPSLVARANTHENDTLDGPLPHPTSENEADENAGAGTDFAGLVAKGSDEPKVKTNEGNMGELTRTSMVKPFTDAAFGSLNQKIGFQPVETAFGFHIIKRTE